MRSKTKIVQYHFTGCGNKPFNDIIILKDLEKTEIATKNNC